MEFRDLKAQYKKYKSEIDYSIQQVISKLDFDSDYYVKELEKSLEQYLNVKHCISCGNGTDALQIALMALDIKENDVVFVPDFTFFASGEVVAFVGATPIFVDVNSKTYNIDAGSLENAIQYVIENTDLNPKAVIVVDLFGLPADYEALRRITDKYNLFLIEDGAQGFGGSNSGKKSCTFGDISTTSFFPAKPLGCYGDGGGIFTNDDRLAATIKLFKYHGMPDNKSGSVRIGMNSRLDALQAGVLLAKLPHLEEEIKKCNEVAAQYNELLSDVNIQKPYIPNEFYSSWAQYTILLNNSDERDRVIKALKDKDIPSMIYYQVPMHDQIAFEKYRKYNGSINHDVTNDICRWCLSLPMSAYITNDEINRITEVINKVVGENE